MILAAPSTFAPRLSPAKEQAAIRTLRASHNAALAAFDADGAIHLSTDDYVMVLGGSGRPIAGKVAYRDFVRAAFAAPHPMRFARTPDRIDVGALEGFAVAAETGRWTGTATDGSGAWRIASETYVTVD